MTTFWTNLLAWSLQVAIVTVAAAVLAAVFRLRESRARLWYWRVVLVVCLALPLLQPWIKPAPRASEVTITTGQFRLAAAPPAKGNPISLPQAGMIILAGGIALRLLWLCAGLIRLRRYRVTAVPFDGSEVDDLRRLIAPEAEILLSNSIKGPVTFGLWNPAILLPARFGDLALHQRRSIVCHELIHVQRRDWAVVIAEELIRSVMWFHPGFWWILGQIQISREQAVDEAVIAELGDRDRYLDALLAIASLRLSADLAPAPLFLKKRHLRQRVESIVSGVNMTKRNLLLPLAAALATLPLVIGIAAWQFPLRAAPQEAVDDSGVDIDMSGVKILHRTGIAYPDEARAKHISGTVVASVTVDDKGEVTGAQAVSGPDELRKPVVQSVLNWHFSLDSPGSPHTFNIAVRFDGGRAPAPSHADESKLLPPSDTDIARTVESVNLSTLPASLRDKLSQSGLLRVGDSLTRDGFMKLESSLREIDDHLRLTGALRGDKMALMVRLAPTHPSAMGAVRSFSSAIPATPPGPNGEPPKSIRVGGNVQSANLLSQTRPVYPPLAKQAHIQGVVRFNVIIGPDGFVKNISAISGHPMLVQAAMDAVKEWVYKPTLLNGNPVEVITTVDVNFTLADGPPPAPEP